MLAFVGEDVLAVESGATGSVGGTVSEAVVASGSVCGTVSGALVTCGSVASTSVGVVGSAVLVLESSADESVSSEPQLVAINEAMMSSETVVRIMRGCSIRSVHRRYRQDDSNVRTFGKPGESAFHHDCSISRLVQQTQCIGAPRRCPGSPSPVRNAKRRYC